MQFLQRTHGKRRTGAVVMGAALSFSLAAATVGFADDKAKDLAASVKTESPIKHVIILIGENRGTDHTFGVYKPKG